MYTINMLQSRHSKMCLTRSRSVTLWHPYCMCWLAGAAMQLPPIWEIKHGWSAPHVLNAKGKELKIDTSETVIRNRKRYRHTRYLSCSGIWLQSVNLTLCLMLPIRGQVEHGFTSPTLHIICIDGWSSKFIDPMMLIYYVIHK